MERPPPARAAPGMPGDHIPVAQRQHAQRQGSAGVHWKTIQKNQVVQFGARAPVTSRRAIARAVEAGPKTAAQLIVRRYRPGRTLTDR